MKLTQRLAALFAFATLAAIPPPAVAQGSPGTGAPGQLANRGVTMTDMTVKVEVTGQVATTHLIQTLHNHAAAGTRPAEATWIFPLPSGAVVDGFVLSAGGIEMPGDVLDKGAARAVYESIVRRRRDPGLLEYAGRGLLRASVFPIPPGEDVAIDVTWRQVLPREAGLLRYSVPLEQAGLVGRPPERIVLDMQIQTTSALSNVFSPNLGVDVLRTGAKTARVTFEATQADRPESELEVFFRGGAEEFGLDVMAAPGGEGEAGTLMLLVAPPLAESDAPVLPKSISVVLDRSGSMRGEKFEQAKRALLYFLDTLSPADHFNVIPFSSGAEPFFDEPAPATPENLAKARERVVLLGAGGGTNIEGALKAALKAEAPAGSLPIVVFVTDGLPTVGLREAKELLRVVDQRNQAGTRIFAMGVGHDVNIPLLDKLAEKNHGTRNYVKAGEDIEAPASALVRKLSRPVMSDLALAIDGVELDRAVPSELPDLFEGDRLQLFARYTGTGTHEVRLSGMYGGERKVFAFTASFDANSANDFVPSLWAERRIAVLLDEMRLYGQADELFEEVIALGREYNIVTPYTSHLALDARESGRVMTGSSGWFLGRGEGGGGGAPGSPGSGSPSPGSPAPAAPGSPAGSPRGSSHGGTYRGPGDSVPTGGGAQGVDDLAWLTNALKEAGALPKDATDEELKALALTIAAELRDSASALDGLGKNESGKAAVDDSTYLASMMRGARRSSSSKVSLLALLTRRIDGRHFDLREGKWIDRDFDEATMQHKVVSIEAFSDAYFTLFAQHPELGKTLALSDRMVIVLGERVVEIVPAPEVLEPAPSGAEGDDVADVDEARGGEVEAKPNGKDL